MAGEKLRRSRIVVDTTCSSASELHRVVDRVALRLVPGGDLQRVHVVITALADTTEDDHPRPLGRLREIREG